MCSRPLSWWLSAILGVPWLVPSPCSAFSLLTVSVFSEGLLSLA